MYWVIEMNRSSHLVIAIAVVLVAGCTESKRSLPVPEDYPTDSSISSPTEAISPTQPSEAQGLSSTSAVLVTATALPETPLISYVVYGGDGEASSELNTCVNWLAPHERFALYDDGQLIQYKSGSIIEAQLTPSEIQDLISRLERTGFREIEETSKAPDGYDIYNLPDDYQYGDGGWGRSIAIRGRRIHIRDSLWDYIIPSIEDTLKLIETYEPPGGAAPYLPSEIEVFVLPKDSGYLPEELFESATEWPSELPPIDQVWFLDEADTATLLSTSLYTSFPDIRAFRYEGTEYVVVSCPSGHSH
jgi:hypothetical protein